ncbi:hypothetical protein [Mycobacterium gastri]|uniref:Uncharacterized protein n=1 Tax=Mycobacterium gastri TaxID=1777 RepID=A0A1X1VE84_MYCGS|nr:hypothetical protein [Mycobacterium gastri]ETW24874.1 hypothetical protein MGAST_05850 [Mycobacterium gastri 'Wayne']ORV67430.1 hypothetical protein AWC07_00915 [Mycobacterium gastri]
MAVANYRRISAKAAVGAAVVLFVLHAMFHVWTAAVPLPRRRCRSLRLMSAADTWLTDGA